MSAETTESVLLSSKAVELILGMREDENIGLIMQIEVMEEILFEIIRDETIGDDNNKKYMRYLVDVIEFHKSLLPD